MKTYEELGIKMASKAFGAARYDDRAKQLKKDVITNLFQSYIGKSMPFYIKTRKDTTPTKYTLIEVRYLASDKPMTVKEGNLELHFSADNIDIPAGTKPDDAPFVNSKKDIVMLYSINEDKYINESAIYHFNQNMVNFLIKAAGIIRNLYYTSFPKKIDGIITKENEQLKKTRLTKANFQMFLFDINNMLNK